jgi:HAD superfamily hydrolase (TIGR01549 family)
MDGVILRGRGTPQVVYDRAAERAADEIGVSPSDEAMALLRKHGYVTVARGCSLADIEPRDFWRLKEKHACEVCAERLRDGKRGVYDDTDAVEKLADETTIALVSNNRQETVEFIVEQFDLPFDLAHGREPTPEGFARRKPFPDLLVDASDALGVETRESLYVGDRRKDVAAAKAAGMEAVYLRRPHNDEVPLPKGADHELGSLDDLLRVVS